jgi:hypothetical protein
VIRPCACHLFPILAFLCDDVFVRLTPTGGGAVITIPSGEEGYTFPEGNLVARHDSLGLLGAGITEEEHGH